MHLIPSNTEARPEPANELETIALSGEQLDYLGQLARRMNPDMPASFALPHLIRTILDRVEQSGIDLTAACSEEEIARLAAGPLRQTRARRRQCATETTFSSGYSATRRSYRSNRPGTDRFHSGRPPRSGRG